MGSLGSSPETVGPEWAALLCALPGYTPFRAPGDSWFDPERAAHAVEFIETAIRHVEGDLAGKPFLLQPWQKSWVCNLFGWQKKDRQGRTVRRYRETILYLPRKSGKTPLSAAVALYVFFCDHEAGQQNYIAAADREQAGLLFRQAKGMVEQEKALKKRCRAYGGNASAGQSRSLMKPDNSYIRVISADADTKHGGNPHLVIVDELHAQPTRDLVDVLTTSMASVNRKQSLLIFITTADFDRPSICNEKHEYACKVRDGVIEDTSFLPAIWETPVDADWTSPDVWAACNPNLGVSVSIDHLERECNKAKEQPDYENTFKRLHLNMKTTTDSKAIDLPKWDACPSVTPGALLGRPCWGGLDMSTTTDLTAFALVFNLGEGEGWAALLWLWAPAEKARQRSRADRVPYEAWAARGLLKLTPGDVVDYDVVRADINALGSRYNIREIAADRWNATQILTQLAGDGFDVVAFGQGFASMTAPTKELLSLVAQGKLAHDHSPAMRWMAGNLAVEEDAAGNKKPSKKKSSDRIDGMVAVVMSLGRGMLAPPPGSVYDGRGVLTVDVAPDFYREPGEPDDGEGW